MKQKQGFNVYDGTDVYIGSSSKGTIRPIVLKMIKDVWNTDPSIKKMKKHVKQISIYKISSRSGFVYTGKWNDIEKKLVIKDHDGIDMAHYKAVIYHEIKGHAFWHWAVKYRAEELRKFNELANNMPPVNGYVERRKEMFKRIVDRNDPSQTLYANEQHSAMVEVMEGVEEGKYHTCTLTSTQKEQMIEAYKRLHY